MASANFPKKGAQARRRVDEMIGEIYASDPQKDILTVRWRTSAGFETCVCTSEAFARGWALTGTLTPEKAAFNRLGWFLALVVILVTVGTFLHSLSRKKSSNAGASAADIPAPIGSRYDISIPPGTITLTAEQLETAYSYNAHKSGSYANIDWNSYPVYVVSRYDPDVHWSIENTWKSELDDEIRLGGFQVQ
jgi:hypothetical protein